MTAEWKPGDVAMVSITPRVGNDDPTEYVAFYAGRYGWYGVTDGEGCGGLTDSDDNFFIHRRPLVVIDPEEREAVERLLTAYLEHGWTRTPDDAPIRTTGIGYLQAALREFADPKPPALTEQPMDLAARVLDRDGDVWARESGSSWGCLSTQSAPQAWIDLVNVCGPLRLMEVAQ